MARAKKKVKSRAEELLDELLSECKGPEEILGKNGLVQQLTKRAIERALAGELTTHLGYPAHERLDQPRENTRNGSSLKTLVSEHGALTIEVPRDRAGSFEPQLIPKNERRLKRIDEQIIALYTSGMTTRDIQAHLLEIYGVDVSPTLISNVTAELSADAQAWQNRALDPMYPIVYFDALFVKTRQNGASSSRAVYLALAINMEGRKELLGLWIAESEGASFWLSVLTELQNRGMRDCLIACVDGLNGFEQAIETVFPRACLQLCIVHQVRNSLRQTSWKHRKALALTCAAFTTHPPSRQPKSSSNCSPHVGMSFTRASVRVGAGIGPSSSPYSTIHPRSAR
jgi:putative transposase